MITNIPAVELRDILRRALNTQEPDKIFKWALELSDRLEIRSDFTVAIFLDDTTNDKRSSIPGRVGS